MVVIYISFNDFRREEFKERFRQRLVFTTHYISQNKNFDEIAPIFFNENEDNILLNEQFLIFNNEKKLIYSTVKDENVTWDQGLLSELDKSKTIYRQNTNPEVYAALRSINGENYYILTSAEDINGNSKLEYLKYLLIISYVISTLIIWFLSYYFVGKFLKPLEKLNKEVSQVTTHQLLAYFPVSSSKKYQDEIDVLAQSFNTMVKRLNDVFQSQKDFTSSASHEIRTPLTRMAFKLKI